MAGTGDVNLLRLFRKAHGRIDTPGHYGAHVANHMAIGLLFLGGGRFTLGQSDSAIAMMVIAFFPPFPNGASDNRAHLQAYRHLWCLAVEPRLLVVEDIETKKVSYLPIKLVRRGDESGSRTEEIVNAPTLLPSFSDISSLSTATERYWPSSLNVSSNRAHSRKLLITRTMQVKRRTGYLSYADDPNGFRSIFNRSSSSSDWVGIGLTSDSSTDLGLSDLKELVRSFATAPQHRAFVEFICSPSSSSSSSASLNTKAFKRFCTDVLMECLTLDKPSLIGPYLSLYLLSDLGAKGRGSSLHLRELEKVLDFYDRHAFKTLRVSSGTNESILPSTKDHRKPLIYRGLLDRMQISTRKKTVSEMDSMNPDQTRVLRLLQRYSSSLDFSSAVDDVDSDEKKVAARQLSFHLVNNQIPGVSTLSRLKDLIARTCTEMKGQLSNAEATLVMKTILRSLAAGDASEEGAGENEQRDDWGWLESGMFEAILKGWLAGNVG